MGAGQPRPRRLPCGTTMLVAKAVPQDPHMALHAREDQPEDKGHLVVHQRGGPAGLQEHLTALRSAGSNVIGAQIWFNDLQTARSNDTLALSVPRLAWGHTDVRWHFAALRAGLLSRTG